MKIGILTLPVRTNYGGILQAYALQTILKKMGHDVAIIEEKPRLFNIAIWKIPIRYIKRILRNIKGEKVPIFYEQKASKEAPIVEQYTNQFIKKHLNIKKYENFDSIKKNEYDVIIVGSDQIWRPAYFPSKIENAYLKFARNWNIRRVAYAASFGTDIWEYTSKQTKECRKLLALFNTISVREKSGIELCKKYFSRNALLVLDPTMLLQATDYIQLFKVANIPKGPGTLFNYILDETPEKEALIYNIARQKRLIPFRVNSKVENIFAPLSERIHPPVEEWLRGFNEADFIVTDSFHACVFSIIFKKQFIVYGNDSRGMARFVSLLSELGLTDRLVTQFEDFLNVIPINYDEVYQRLEKMKKYSIQFIANTLQ